MIVYRIWLGVVAVVCLLAAGCGGGPGEGGFLTGVLAAFAPMPERFETPANPLTPEKIELGRMLYSETALSAGGDMSCNTCHRLDSYGVDGVALSPGYQGVLSRRNTPSIYNAAGQFAEYWDGRGKSVEDESHSPLLDREEMAMESPEAVVEAVRGLDGYQQAFARAFPDAADPVTFENLTLALGAYLRTLSTPAPWDRFLAGDEQALTDAQKRGFQVFTDAGCVHCHRGALVGGDMYNRLGSEKAWPVTSDLGRYEITDVERDRMVFKVPSLRNVTETAPYYHDGSVATLEEAVSQMSEYELDRILTDEEVAAIVDWLGSLRGETKQ